MYRIRKNSNWWISASSGGNEWWIILIILSLLLPTFYIIMHLYLSEFPDLSTIPNLTPYLYAIPFLLLWIRQYKRELKMDKAKKLKRNGWWIIKKVKITSIERYETHWWDENSKWFSWYYAEAKEWDMIYCSDAYAKWHMWWTSLSTIKEIYNSYWYEYDENETHKQEVLKAYNDFIAKKHYEEQSWWFLKKLSAKWELFFAKWQKEIIEKWYKPPYREVNWKRITVWDTVDVYIDPKDETNYWMDIDFLFDK